ncbi:helix-turn-helix domain-containing protein [Paenibacillus polymyxa]|uniref:helix-turn-helix domain-containing protein n=1 Tax=Paenibacillus polymyxa TaxID=1406 RepID=UPI00397735A2
MKAIEMRWAGVPVREVMEQLGIWNKTQLKTWMRWYRTGEEHRLEQNNTATEKACKSSSRTSPTITQFGFKRN